MHSGLESCQSSSCRTCNMTLRESAFKCAGPSVRNDRDDVESIFPASRSTKGIRNVCVFQFLPLTCPMYSVVQNACCTVDLAEAAFRWQRLAFQFSGFSWSPSLKQPHCWRACRITLLSASCPSFGHAAGQPQKKPKTNHPKYQFDMTNQRHAELARAMTDPRLFFYRSASLKKNVLTVPLLAVPATFLMVGMY